MLKRQPSCVKTMGLRPSPSSHFCKGIVLGKQLFIPALISHQEVYSLSTRIIVEEKIV